MHKKITTGGVYGMACARESSYSHLKQYHTGAQYYLLGAWGVGIPGFRRLPCQSWQRSFNQAGCVYKLALQRCGASTLFPSNFPLEYTTSPPFFVLSLVASTRLIYHHVSGKLQSSYEWYILIACSITQVYANHWSMSTSHTPFRASLRVV